MDQKIKFSIITITIIVIVFAGLFSASISQNFLFTSYAKVEEVENNENASTWKVFDGETYLGEIYFRIEHSPSGLQQNQITIAFSLFYNQTELDSVKIRFSGGNSVISLYKKAYSYDWKYEFRMKGGDVSFEVPDLEWFGQSTATLDFILVPFDATNLYLNMVLSMHRTTPLQLTSIEAHVNVDAPIPKGAI